MINKTHYVSLVPAWLAEQLSVIGTDIRIVKDLKQLSTIVSAEDVSFYYLYNLRATSYVGNTFADLTPFFLTPQNLEWVNENADAIKKAKLHFDSKQAKFGKDLSDADVDPVVRKTFYQPKAIEENVLALVGFTGGDKSTYVYSQFCRDCCSVLNKQILFEQYKHFEVFKEYTRHA